MTLFYILLEIPKFLKTLYQAEYGENVHIVNNDSGIFPFIIETEYMKQYQDININVS